MLIFAGGDDGDGLFLVGELPEIREPLHVESICACVMYMRIRKHSVCHRNATLCPLAPVVCHEFVEA